MSSGKGSKKAEASARSAFPRSRSKAPAKIPFASRPPGGPATAARAPHTSAMELYDPSMEAGSTAAVAPTPQAPAKASKEAEVQVTGDPADPDQATEAGDPKAKGGKKYRFSSVYAQSLSDDGSESDDDDDKGDPEQRRDFLRWVTNAEGDYGHSQNILFSHYHQRDRDAKERRAKELQERQANDPH